VLAVVTIDDVTEFRCDLAASEKPGLVTGKSANNEPGERIQADQAHSRLVESLGNFPSFFAMADAEGALYYLDPAGRALLGLDNQDETYGVTLLDCHAPVARAHLKQVVMPAAARDGSWSGESILLARDGTEIRTTLVITAHHSPEGKLVGYTVQEQDMTEWVKAEEALRATQSDLPQLAAQHLTMREAERRRIAADLHDGLGQSLSLLKLGIQEALRQMGDNVSRKAVDSVTQLIPKVEGALNELHRVAMDLRPSTLDDLGIIPTLSWFAREFENANLKTRIEKHISVTEKDVPEPLKIAIFRILQEAVNNAVKHSDAACIKVSLHNGGDVLTFSVEDDGKGFNPCVLVSRGEARRGLGLQSMKERAELSGGRYAVTSAVGQGTKVCVWWPSNKPVEIQPGIFD
jgi:PAS domain S-box-containing protein